MIRFHCAVILLSLSFFSSVSANVALNKPGLASSLYGKNNASSLTDGKYARKEDCTETKKETFSWLGVNLQRQYKLEKLRIIPFPEAYRREDSVNIYIARKFRSFAPQSDLHLCAENVKLPDSAFEVQCKDGPINAQYIFISKKDSKTPLMICELEALGSEVAGAVPDARPQLRDENITLDGLTIGARKVILKETGNITLPIYTSRVDYYKAESEAILWTQNEAKRVAMVASLVGKGKLITCGNHNFINSIFNGNNYNKLRQNLYQWFGVIPTSKFRKIQRNTDVISDGDIVFVEAVTKLDASTVNQILDRLKSGRNPVIIAWKGWVNPERLVNGSLQPIFDEAGVSISEEITNWNDAILAPEKYEDDYSTLPLEIAIDILEKSSEFFTQNAANILKIIDIVPSRVLQAFLPKLTSIRAKYNALIDWMIPTNSNGVANQQDKNFVLAFNRLILSQAFAGSGYKVPYVDIYPGDIPNAVKTTSAKLKISADNSGEFHPTGYYLPPGETLQWEVVAQTGKLNDWAVRIGCHTDDNSRKEEYKRFPIISSAVPLTAGRIYSPFGGVVWIRNNRENVSLTVVLRNVVENPFFNLRDSKNIANWNKSRNSPGPWAELAGDMMVLCVESKHVRSLDSQYVGDVLENIWDKVVKMDIDLKGKDWRNKRRQRTTTDVQISAGDGHSGYPLMTHLYWINGILNRDKIRKDGSWGMCHEIGHNMQEGAWTPGGTGEVTNNLMCLYNYERLWSIPISRRFNDQAGVLQTIKKLLNNNPSENTWTSDPFVALGFYAQLATHFGFGFYHDVFRVYIDRQLNPQNNVDKLSTWLETTSSVANLNLSPLFDFWNIPYNDKARQEVSKLRCFFPKDDVFVRTVTERAATIRGKYPNCADTGIKIGGDGPWNLSPGMKDNDVVVL